MAQSPPEQIEGVCSLEKVATRIREWLEKKLYGEVRIRIVAGKIKETTYTESQHFD